MPAPRASLRQTARALFLAMTLSLGLTTACGGDIGGLATRAVPTNGTVPHTPATRTAPGPTTEGSPPTASTASTPSTAGIGTAVAPHPPSSTSRSNSPRRPGPTDATTDRAAPSSTVAEPTTAPRQTPSHPAPTTMDSTTPRADPGTPPAAGTPSPDGPPSWIKPGMRIGYYESVASVGGNDHGYTPSANGPWVDPNTGQHYDRTDTATDGGGDAIRYVDILAVEGDSVLAVVNLYGIDHTAQVYTPGTSYVLSRSGATLDGTYVNPDALAAAAANPPDGTGVFVGDYPINGQTYDAMGFATTDPAHYTSYTYDRKTGVLLQAITKYQNATSPLVASDDSTPTASTQLGQTVLLEARQRSVPGLGGTNPSWVASAAGLSYSGTYVLNNPYGGDTYSFPMKLDIQFGNRAEQFVQYSATSQVFNSPLKPSTTNGVSGPSGPWWMDPAALGALKAGQVIDQDSATNEVFSVVDVSNGTVTTKDAIPGVTTTNVWDRATGVMLALQIVEASSGYTTTLQLDQKPQ